MVTSDIDPPTRNGLPQHCVCRPSTQTVLVDTINGLADQMLSRTGCVDWQSRKWRSSETNTPPDGTRRDDAGIRSVSVRVPHPIPLDRSALKRREFVDHRDLTERDHTMPPVGPR